MKRSCLPNLFESARLQTLRPFAAPAWLVLALFLPWGVAGVTDALYGQETADPAVLEDVAETAAPESDGDAAAEDEVAAGEESTGDESADDGPTIIREQTLYVPFDQLEEVFEKEGRGIFLPYERFLQLWEASQPDDPPPPPDEPPAAAVIRGARYSGEVRGEVATLRAVFGLESLKKGWTSLVLPLTSVAIEEVTITRSDNAAGEAALFSTDAKGYAFYLPAPGKYEATMTFSVRIVKTPGKKSFRFGVPAAAVSRLELTVPESEIRVDVQPHLAVSEANVEGENTRVVAYLGNATDVTLSWSPTAGKSGEGAVVFASQSIHTHLGERILKIDTTLDYSVLRGEIDTFRIAVPENTRLLSVNGNNIREWSEEDGGILKVQLHAAVKDKYRLALTFERILTDTPSTLGTPFPRAVDVLRESGHYAFSHDEGLNVRVTDASGLSQLDPADVPDNLKPYLGTGYRYLAQPLALELAIEKITPVVRAAVTSVVTLGPEEDLWSGWIDYDIKKAGIFRLSFSVPTDWTVVSAGSPDLVEEFRTEDTDGRRNVTVSLKSKALNTFRLPFSLTREGSAQTGETTLAPVLVADVVQDRGLFGVSAPRSFEVRTIERTNMLDVDIDELFRSGIMGQISSESSVPRTFRYREQPASVRLQLEARKTEIDVDAEHLVEVGDGEISFTLLLHYTVEFAPTDVLKFRAPSALDDLLKVTGKRKTQTNKLAVDGGYTLWEVTLTPPAIGAETLNLSYRQDLKGLSSQEASTQAVPRIQAVDVRNETGVVAIRKDANLEIVPETEELELMEPSELPDTLRGRQIYSAFKYFEPTWSLNLKLTRHDYQPLATTAVEHIAMRSVLTGQRRLRTVATLVVQNTEKQYLKVGIPPETILTLAVNGSQKLARKTSDPGSTLIEIPRSAGRDGAFPVTIVYEQPLANSAMGSFGSVSMRTLEVLDDIPIGRISLDLFLPPEYAYLAWGGNLKPRQYQAPGLWQRLKRVVHATHNSHQSFSPGRRQGEVRVQVDTRGVDIPLTVDGLAHRGFESMSPVGDLSFFYSGRTLLAFFDFLVFLGAAVGVFYLLKLKPWTTRFRLGLLACLVPIILTWFSRGAAADIFVSVFLGAMMVCVFYAVRHLVAKYREFRATRLAMAPDPFLEEATVSTSVTTPPANGENAGDDEASGVLDGDALEEANEEDSDEEDSDEEGVAEDDEEIDDEEVEEEDDDEEEEDLTAEDEIEEEAPAPPPKRRTTKPTQKKVRKTRRGGKRSAGDESNGSDDGGK